MGMFLLIGFHRTGLLQPTPFRTSSCRITQCYLPMRLISKFLLLTTPLAVSPSTECSLSSHRALGLPLFSNLPPFHRTEFKVRPIWGSRWLTDHSPTSILIRTVSLSLEDNRPFRSQLHGQPQVTVNFPLCRLKPFMLRIDSGVRNRTCSTMISSCTSKARR